MSAITLTNSSRYRVIDVAVDLFYRNGCHAVQIDDVARAAGVDRRSIEQHFATKDALILAALERRDAWFRELLDEHMARAGMAPVNRLLSLFDFLEQWYAGPGFHGCMFINASIEFPDADSPIRRAASIHKQAIYDTIRQLSLEAVPGPDAADSLASQLVLLMEGAIVTTQVCGSCDIARQAQDAAHALIRHAMRESLPSLPDGAEAIL